MSKNKDKSFSTHHILPRSMGGNSEKKNLVELRDNYHRSIHTLFANKMLAEQLLTTIDISAKALRRDVREWLVEVLNSRDINDPYEWYDDKVIL